MLKEFFKPVDWIILIFLLVLLAWLYKAFWFSDPAVAKLLSIKTGDKPTLYYSLDKDQHIEIKGNLGKSEIEISKGKARFSQSPCQNQFCVLHGWLNTAGDTIACLPNRISISLYSKHPDYDAVNY